ncbi:MAG: S8/S53 family peptidase [Myxococcales bacterium]|nr:S8/S53 family peptidase [Myxococcales bacterium]
MRVLDQSRNLRADQFIDVIVELSEMPFPEIRQLKRMDDETRQQVLLDREVLVRDAQTSFAKHALWYGSQTLQSLWIANQLRLLVPAGAMERVLGHPDVRAVHAASARGVSDYDGLQIREQTFMQRFHDDGYDGEWGGRTYNPDYGYNDIKIAIVEAWGNPLQAPNRLNDTHPGWRDCGTCSSRLRANYECDGMCLPAPSSSLPTHGTVVTWTAVGDLTDDQDCVQGVGVCNALEQEERTGVAPEASIMYFRTRSFNDVASAMFLAGTWGADIINLSQSVLPCSQIDECPLVPCESATVNYGSVNEWIRYLTDMGALVVGSGGNRNNDTLSSYPDDLDCNHNYPGWRPELLSVAGIGTAPTEEDPLEPYDVEPIGDYSGRGWLTVGMGGWFAETFPTVQTGVVSISAPGVIDLYYAEDGEYSDTSEHEAWSVPLHGNSVAIPVMSGAAGLMRQATGNVDARALKAMVLVMGDGTDSVNSNFAYNSGPSHIYGTGKFKGHRFGGLEAPTGALYNWSWHLDEGQELSLAFPTGAAPQGVTQLKWAVYVDQPDLSQVPWVFLSVDNVCDPVSPFGATDMTYGLQKFVSVKAPIFQGGRCAKAKIYGFSVPAGGVDVYIAAYYHSGDPDEH